MAEPGHSSPGGGAGGGAQQKHEPGSGSGQEPSEREEEEKGSSAGSGKLSAAASSKNSVADKKKNKTGSASSASEALAKVPRPRGALSTGQVELVKAVFNPKLPKEVQWYTRPTMRDLISRKDYTIAALQKLAKRFPIKTRVKSGVDKTDVIGQLINKVLEGTK